MGLHKVELVVTNDAEKKTAWFGLGEMDLEDVLDLEVRLLELIAQMAKENRAKLPKS